MKIKLLSSVLLAGLFFFSSCEEKTVEKESNIPNASKEIVELEKEIKLEPFTPAEAASLRADVLSLIDQSEIMFEELFVLDSIDASEAIITAKADSALEVYTAFMIQMKETSESARPETEQFIKASGKLIYHFMTIAKVHKDYASKLSVFEDEWTDEDWNEWTSIVDPQYQDWINAKEEFKTVLSVFEAEHHK